MKRQFTDQGKDSELTDEDPLDCAFYDFDPKASLANSCCNKCKNCFGQSGSLNPRHSDVALRLKEKSKKKKEAAEKGINQSLLKDSPKKGQRQHTSEETTMNIDYEDYLSISQSAGLGDKVKCRSSSNNSSTSGQTAEFEELCTLKVDCNCKNCQERQKIGEELIAEEESSKKKKAKKKKKKNAKKGLDNLEDDNDDEDTKVKPDTEDEDSHEHGNSSSRNSNSVDPTSVDINQWIKVKNKNTANTHNLKNSISKSSLSNKSSISSNTQVASGSHHHEAEMESNGFKLIGGKESNAEKKKGTNLDGVAKDLDAMTIADFKNGPAAVEKAKLLSIEANLAYIRGEPSVAIHLVTQCMECDKKSPEYFINRSFYHEKSKNYAASLKDAEMAIKLDEGNETFLEYALYRKAKAYAGQNRFDLVETELKKIIKLMSIKCKSDAQAFNSYMVTIEKDLMINRLKKLVSIDYTLPLARLYAIKFGSIQAAVEAIGKNIQLLEGAKENSLNLELHLQLINGQLQKTDVSTSNAVKEAKLLSRINGLSGPQPSSSQKRQMSKKSTSQDCWNFNEKEEERISSDKPLLLRDLLRDTGGTNQKIDEEAFLSQYDDDDDDSEVYFSDEEDYEKVSSKPEGWNKPKDILINTGNAHYFTDELREPINSNGQKALWIGNLSPECSQNLVSHVFMKFGSVTFCSIFQNERSSDIAYLLLHYDNDISPRLVTAYFKDQVVPKISKDNLPLIIRFRNKNDKGEEGGEGGAIFNSGNIPKTALSPQSPSHHLAAFAGSSGTSGNKQSAGSSECYYWRTTGCDWGDRCMNKHIPAHRGIDKAPWMRRKN